MSEVTCERCNYQWNIRLDDALAELFRHAVVEEPHPIERIEITPQTVKLR